MLSPHPDPVRPSRRLPTTSGDPAMQLLQAALDPEVSVGQLRAMNDAYEGRGAAMASVPGMGKN